MQQKTVKKPNVQYNISLDHLNLLLILFISTQLLYIIQSECIETSQQIYITPECLRYDNSIISTTPLPVISILNLFHLKEKNIKG